MKILIVSDSYAPRIDGVAIAVSARLDSLRRERAHVSFIAASTSPTRASIPPGLATALLVRSVPYGPARYPLTTSFVGISKFLHEVDVDRFEIHSLGPVGLLALHWARRRGIPVRLFWHTDLLSYSEFFRVATCAGLTTLAVMGISRVRWSLDRSRRIRLALRDVLLLCDEVVAPSEKAAAQVKSLGFLGRLTVDQTELGELFATRSAPPGLELQYDDRSSVVYIGRLSREKNLPLLLEAIGRVRDRGRGCRLILAGPAGDRTTARALRRWVRRNPDVATILGPITRTEVVLLMQSGFPIVIPSLSEAQCLVLREALALRAPVVLVDELLARPLLKMDGVTVKLASPESDSLARAIEDVLDSEQSRGTGPHVQGALHSVGPSPGEPVGLGRG